MHQAYPPHDGSQHMGMAPPSAYQPPPPHAIPSAGAPIHSYQHQHPPPAHQQQPLPPHLPPPGQHLHAQPLPQPHPPPHSQQHQPRHQQPPPPPPPLPHSSISARPNESAPPNHISVKEHAPNPQQLIPVSRIEDGSGRRYHLDVAQQPQRARMCGFGDKDRRPITPPPCVRLVITDIATGEEINVKDIDCSMFVLNVDLWDEHGSHEVNLCRQPSSTGAPALSAPPTYQYPSLNGGEPGAVPYGHQPLPASRDPAYPQQPPVGYSQDYHVQSSYSQAPPSYPPNATYGPPQQYFPQHQSYRPEQSLVPPQRYETSGGYGDVTTPGGLPNDQYKGALNRNLIGSVAASAFCLTDTSNREGIWFVLQDLSVRLEGTYRLKFSFVNVGLAGTGTRDRPSYLMNRNRAPILASCFSEAFNVWSAKKFPGVCDSTALSKTFATQGIKIPIRKDGDKGKNDDDGD